MSYCSSFFRSVDLLSPPYPSAVFFPPTKGHRLPAIHPLYHFPHGLLKIEAGSFSLRPRSSFTVVIFLSPAIPKWFSNTILPSFSPSDDLFSPNPTPFNEFSFCLTCTGIPRSPARSCPPSFVLQFLATTPFFSPIFVYPSRLLLSMKSPFLFEQFSLPYRCPEWTTRQEPLFSLFCKVFPFIDPPPTWIQFVFSLSNPTLESQPHLLCHFRLAPHHFSHKGTITVSFPPFPSSKM